MTTPKPDIIAAIHETIEIPDSAYEAAEKRYQNVADWLGSDAARCQRYDPHITPQGSFRIGTVIRPLTDEEEYDLDLSCQLERGYSKTQHSQSELKALVGQDLEDYRVARRIEQAREEIRDRVPERGRVAEDRADRGAGAAVASVNRMNRAAWFPASMNSCGIIPAWRSSRRRTPGWSCAARSHFAGSRKSVRSSPIPSH